MKTLALACLLLAGCTSIAEHRARTIAADSQKCRELHGDQAVTFEFLECMDTLAQERAKKREAEETRHAAEETWRVPLPIPTIDHVY